MNKPNTQVVPGDGFTLKRLNGDPEKGADQFEEREPELYAAFQLVKDGMGAGLVPERQQREVWGALSHNLRREIVVKEGSLDASTLSTFKQQLTMVTGIMNQLFEPDGRPKDLSVGEEFVAMSHKEAMNLWLKLNQMMTRDLPKIINMERFQRLESALMQVMEESLTEEQRAAVLDKLQQREKK